MDLHRLDIFAKVFELGSLSRSAEAVFLSQPTISGHLKSLEEELGVKLFDRLGRGVTPTQAGVVLYDYALRLLRLRDEAVEAIAALSNNIQGQLKVGGSTIPGHYILPTYLARMRQLYPELIVHLSLGDTRSVGRMVEDGAVEVGIIGARLDNSRLTYTPCCQDELILVTPVGHPLAGRGRVALSELKGLDYLLREAGSGTRMAAARALAAKGLRLTDFNIIAELGSTEAVRRSLLAGLGASILSRLAVEEDLQAGRLAHVEVEGLKITRDFYVVVRAGKSLSPAGRRFLAMIQEE